MKLHILHHEPKNRHALEAEVWGNLSNSSKMKMLKHFLTVTLYSAVIYIQTGGLFNGARWVEFLICDATAKLPLASIKPQRGKKNVLLLLK